MSTEDRYLESLCFRLKMQGLNEKEIEKETGLTHKQVVEKLLSYPKRFKGEPTKIVDTAVSKPCLEIDNLSDTLEEEADFFKLPDGRDSELYLYKNADKQRDKVQ